MTAEEHLKVGDLEAALSALQDEVRKNPQIARLRIFLFQLLAVMGDWKRAVAQLKLCGELDSTATPMAQTYREAITCEVYRAKVFEGRTEPLIFGEPKEWVALLVEALKLDAAGKSDEAAGLRARAFELAPAVSGRIDGARFEWIADADSRLGPVLEIVVNGKYYWMPFSAIKQMTAEQPQDLRDFVWTAVTLTLTTGGEVVGLIPTRYIGTEHSDDDAAKLARATHWTDVGNNTYLGTGQRLLATEQADYPILEFRSLELDQDDISEPIDG